MKAEATLPLIIAGTGIYLAWFAIHYWGSDTKWPSDPVKAVLQGNAIPSPSGAQTAVETASIIEGTSATAATGGGAAGGGSAPPVSGNYNVAQLQSLWTANGGAAAKSFEAAQIAMAESSGNPDATSSNPFGGTNVGLWQLDTEGVGAGYTVAQLKDPTTNCRITVMATANGTNWSEWADSVVKNGVYVGPQAGGTLA